jgi:hypothetical protein
VHQANPDIHVKKKKWKKNLKMKGNSQSYLLNHIIKHLLSYE